MAELEFIKVDVFTEDAFLGNPAGIVFDADGLDEVKMQRMAFEMGSPATAFVQRSKKADVKFRFFSPTAEDPLSGHAALGAIWCLAEREMFGTNPGGKKRLETQVGVLPFSVEGSPRELQKVWMTQKRPIFAREGDEKEVASALGTGVDSMFQEQFPICRASTGIPFLLVSMRSVEAISSLAPRLAELSELCQTLDIAGVEAFSWAVIDQSSTVHARCFLPSFAVPEDPASGMAAGALGSYLVENDFIPRERFDRIIIEQGHWVGRPSKIHVRIEKRGSAIRRVEVGGSSRVSSRGRMLVP